MITNEANYKLALERIIEIFDAEPNTPEFEELQKLVAWTEAYEEKNITKWENE